MIPNEDIYAQYVGSFIIFCGNLKIISLVQRTGVEFPERVKNAAPIFTPPLTRGITGHSQLGYGMPSHIASTLDEAMASEMSGLR